MRNSKIHVDAVRGGLGEDDLERSGVYIIRLRDRLRLPAVRKFKADRRGTRCRDGDVSGNKVRDRRRILRKVRGALGINCRNGRYRIGGQALDGEVDIIHTRRDSHFQRQSRACSNLKDIRMGRPDPDLNGNRACPA